MYTYSLILVSKGLATVVNGSNNFLWEVPENWTLEQAATVPVVYTTAYYALVVRGQIRKGDKVLIHSGSGGVGQAAISLALHYGCEVFTTVGSKEKKNYLQSVYPQLVDDHICNSRDTSFEGDILRVTKGKGKLRNHLLTLLVSQQNFAIFCYPYHSCTGEICIQLNLLLNSPPY